MKTRWGGPHNSPDQPNRRERASRISFIYIYYKSIKIVTFDSHNSMLSIGLGFVYISIACDIRCCCEGKSLIRIIVRIGLPPTRTRTFPACYDTNFHRQVDIFTVLHSRSQFTVSSSCNVYILIEPIGTTYGLAQIKKSNAEMPELEAMPEIPGTPPASGPSDNYSPIIDEAEPFTAVVEKLSASIIRAIESTYTYEQLRTSVGGQKLKPLISTLTEECHHTAVVAALLAARWLFISMENDGTELNESRAYACEIVAGQFLTYLSEKELIDYLLYELPTSDSRPDPSGSGGRVNDINEATALLRAPERDLFSTSPAARTDASLTKVRKASDVEDISEAFEGLNALEIAAVANAKKFLSQTQVQKIVTNIWDGDIIFWYVSPPTYGLGYPLDLCQRSTGSQTPFFGVLAIRPT